MHICFLLQRKYYNEHQAYALQPEDCSDCFSALCRISMTDCVLSKFASNPPERFSHLKTVNR